MCSPSIAATITQASSNTEVVSTSCSSSFSSSPIPEFIFVPTVPLSLNRWSSEGLSSPPSSPRPSSSSSKVLSKSRSVNRWSSTGALEQPPLNIFKNDENQKNKKEEEIDDDTEEEDCCGLSLQVVIHTVENAELSSSSPKKALQPGGKKGVAHLTRRYSPPTRPTRQKSDCCALTTRKKI